MPAAPLTPPAETAELLLSELATNAVLHARTEFCDELLIGLGADSDDDIAILAVRPTPSS
ncbi:hypothetical protein [Streptomyces spirodelae]|uniref:ATP-binding protein n=1 Tax=Streptomyces spirodelae TaxID=2812904 RepID=A0ABS3WM11_9ACTN|nr:hypothetical protein [Streptomyces spirodelae]MBO8184157.1 hypothetical protein [Streptomyces spirodelae]